MLLEKRESFLAVKAVRIIERLLLRAVSYPKYFVDFLHAREAGAAGLDREDVVALARFGEQRTRRDQAGDVVHLGPVENPGNVVVDAVRQAEHTIPECIQIAADHPNANTRLERRREQRAGA